MSYERKTSVTVTIDCEIESIADNERDHDRVVHQAILFAVGRFKDKQYINVDSYDWRTEKKVCNKCGKTYEKEEGECPYCWNESHLEK